MSGQNPIEGAAAACGLSDAGLSARVRHLGGRLPSDRCCVLLFLAPAEKPIYISMYHVQRMLACAPGLYARSSGCCVRPEYAGNMCSETGQMKEMDMIAHKHLQFFLCRIYSASSVGSH